MIRHLHSLSHRLQLAFLIGAFAMLGLLYNITLPLFEAPDEIWHFAFADHLADGQGLPYFSEEQKPVYLREAGQPPLYYALAALAIAPLERGDFPGFVRFNASHPSITPGASSDRPNVFVHTAHENWPYRQAVLAVHITRLVSWLFGLITVLGVYAIARQIAPDVPWLAFVSAAMAAFTPQFVLLSNAANNDSLMAATATWSVWASLKLSNAYAKDNHEGHQGHQDSQLTAPSEGQPTWRWAIVLGGCLGLGLLSKLSAIVLLPFAGLVFAVTWLRHPERLSPHTLGAIARDALLAFGTALAVAGWWYMRNTALYGDPLAWQVWLSDIGVRTPTPPVWQLAPELPQLFSTYWLAFNYERPAGWLWAGLGLASLAAAVGCQAIVWRWVRSKLATRSQANTWPAITRALFFDAPPSILNLEIGLVWLGLIVAGVVRYMQTTPAAQGRLLFPAIAITSLLLAGGLAAWRQRWPAYSLAAGLLGLSLAAPFVFICPAFALPVLPSLPAQAQPASARFDNGVELLGYHLPTRTVRAGESLHVTTYWRAPSPLAHAPNLLIRLLRADGQSGGQAHFILGSSLYPGNLWRPGQIVADEHTIALDASLPVGTMLRLQIGLGDETNPLLSVQGPAAWSTGDVVDLGEVEVTAR